MVTIELAAALPVLVLLMGVGLGAIDVARARVACLDAAREGARAAARADDAAAYDWAMRVAPAGAQVVVSRVGPTVTVDVQAWVHPAGLPQPAVQVRGSATAWIEPDSVRPP